jgi:LacI family transcriptional regulator
LDGGFLEDSSGRALACFMNLPARPTALVVQDDMVSYSVIRRLCGLDYKVPDDLAIVSLDHIPLVELSTPSISSIDHGNYNLGAMACRILIENIRHPEQSRMNARHRFTAEHQLIVRESSVLAMPL